MRRSSLAVALVAALPLALVPAAVRAQPAAPALVPPRALGPLEAAYPEGAEGDALVLLELTVNVDGTVREARAVSGPEPFAAAAVAAASRFRFAPATRDGVPVAARIRAEVRFTAPVPAPVPVPVPVSEPAPAPVPASEPAPPQPIDVTVRGEVQAPDVSTFTAAEVRLLPGAFGDPFRAVETLPGVTPMATGLPYFFVRGAPPGNVGYFLDGIRVPLLYHIGLGPSVVHPAIVERVDLYPGGYPARFGRFAGGIVAGATREPLPEWHGEATLRIIDAGAFTEAPFDGGRGAALVGGRYAYPGALLALLGSEIQLSYGDYQARVGYDVTPRDRLTVFAFGAYDFLGEREDDETRILVDTTFHRIDLRYDHRLAPETSIREAVTLGYDQTRLNRGRFANDWLVTTRAELQHRLAGDDADRLGFASTGARLRAGIDATLDRSGADLDRGDGDEHFTSFFSSRLDMIAGAFAEVTAAVTPRLEVTPGLRLDLYESQGEALPALDPRLSARLELSPDVTLFQAHGLASQAPSFILPGPGFRPPLQGGLQRSFQSSAGLEIALPEDVSGKVTLFHNAFFNMTDAFGTSAQNGRDPPDRFDRRALGSSTGVEISAHRRLTRRLGGFVSYTLSRSVRAFERSRIPSSFDRTHVVNAAGVYDFGGGYQAGGRILFYSGIPGIIQGQDGAPRARDERLPPFFRLDVRLEKRWAVGETGWISVVLEGQNVTLTKEAVGIDCAGFGAQGAGGDPEPRVLKESDCEVVSIGPVTIPSLGVSGGF